MAKRYVRLLPKGTARPSYFSEIARSKQFDRNNHLQDQNNERNLARTALLGYGTLHIVRDLLSVRAWSIRVERIV